MYEKLAEIRFDPKAGAGLELVRVAPDSINVCVIDGTVAASCRLSHDEATALRDGLNEILEDWR